MGVEGAEGFILGDRGLGCIFWDNLEVGLFYGVLELFHVEKKIKYVGLELLWLLLLAIDIGLIFKFLFNRDYSKYDRQSPSPSDNIYY